MADVLDLAFRLDRGDFSLDLACRVPARGVSALFGRSGCGKTTVLRCVAGLERAAGHCRLAEACWQDDANERFLPTHRRPIGYVFQEPSLFPHRSVRANLDYGRRRIPARARCVDFDEVVELLGIAPLLGRDPAGLSGGERQRVAIARALLTSPRLLLMDEPLAALDHTSKRDILPYLERLHDHLQIPILYVSHDPDEVARLADHILLIEAGRLRAAGPAPQMLTRLDLPLVREETASALLSGRVRAHDARYGLTRVAIPGASLMLERLDRAVDETVRVRIHARDVSIALDDPGTSSILNVLPAHIVEMHPLSASQVLVGLAVGTTPESRLLARITRHSWERLRLHPGQQVHAQVKAVAVMD
ncbi:molybdenum ABC transporter ATP-binding protein [Marichromatium gracile]|uniref:Molybdate transport system ATP-binding protein n=1 Tax=Marichromatium gracile TaxID=1048 RepID=A0A4V2W9Q8_MARGR|nr:molybdenum ABC transporter ATP-binding protein [Marichromatium gracile]MBK1710679.1 molybdenum ABC transporter ATP-binding protein [Marichromatium gracile]TCW36330.1 molybdate transport system ATP-binding protein [Marichromatium gracile]